MKKDDITKQIFKYLKIEPEEVFRIKDNKNYFKLNKDLQLLYTPTKKYVGKQMWELCGPYLTLSNLLNGTVQILKITEPTDTDIIVINYLKACGCNWMAQDENGEIYGYIEKPIKHANCWDNSINNYFAVSIELPISFLSWEDEEPYYIGDEE